MVDYKTKCRRKTNKKKYELIRICQKSEAPVPCMCHRFLRVTKGGQSVGTDVIRKDGVSYRPLKRHVSQNQSRQQSLTLTFDQSTTRVLILAFNVARQRSHVRSSARGLSADSIELVGISCEHKVSMHC
jgi:hypothetical protein